jgi:hypothetical protein
MPDDLTHWLRSAYHAARRRLAPRWDDRRWLEWRYQQFVGRPPDLRNPTGYREKLLWLNLFYRHPLVPTLVDKYLARDEVARRVGPGVLTELLGVWDRPEAIPFDRLTDPYVLKVTAGSTWNIFCPDPAAVDRPAAVATLDGWMRQNYGDLYREWCYRPLKPRVMAERLMSDPDHPGRSPDDLKVHCFNGRPRFVQVCYDRRGARRYATFDPYGKVIDLGLDGAERCAPLPPPPEGLDDVMDVAAKLSAGFPYVRVDLYRHRGRTVFGEMTWFPSAGNVEIDDPATDGLLGGWIQLPARRPGRAAAERPSARIAHRRRSAV